MLTILHPTTHKPVRIKGKEVHAKTLQQLLPLAKKMAEHYRVSLEIAYVEDGLPFFRVYQDGTTEVVPMAANAIEIELPEINPEDQIFHSHLEL